MPTIIHTEYEVRRWIICLLAIVLCPTLKETKKYAKTITIKRVSRFVSKAASQDFNRRKRKMTETKIHSRVGSLSYILQATLSKTIAVKCSCRYREFKFMQTFQRTSYFHRRSKTTKNLPSVSSQSHANHSHKDENLIHGSINNNNHKD